MAVPGYPAARSSLGGAGHGGCLHGLLAGLRFHAEPGGVAMKSFSVQAVRSVAVKEFIHIYRDWRILVLLLILPPVFTLIFGHAFENTGATGVPALLEDRDHSAASEQFVQQLTSGETFKWKKASRIGGHPDLLRENVKAALVIPQGWGA